MQLANEIPGFAGYYLEPQTGVLVAYVKDSASAFGSASAQLAAHIAIDWARVPARLHPKGIRVQRADYDFQTLSDYRDILSDSLLGRVSGVVLVDLDESINRVTVGVLGATAIQTRANLVDLLRQYGIPQAAVHVEISEPLAFTDGRVKTNRPFRRQLAQTLYNYSSPDTTDTLGAGFYVADFEGCTVGAIADSGSQRMIVIASHCTHTMFSVNGDTLESYNAHAIGVETADPGGTRTSDAAGFRPTGSLASRRGVIARPTTRDSAGLSGARDTTINGTKPWLFVSDTAGASDLVAGMEIDKIGALSGWTHATLNSTCGDHVTVSGSTVHCFYTADHLANRTGDSGGPVFIWDGYDGAVMAGISSYGVTPSGTYWNGISYTGTGFFSWSNVASELGGLSVINNTTVGTPSISGSISSGNAVASWSAVSTTNTTATTQYQIFQSTWDASAQNWTQQGAFIGSITALSYTDTSAPWTMSSVTGSQPDACTYSSVSILIRAYNQGAFAYSNVVWYRGPANGPGGGAC